MSSTTQMSATSSTSTSVLCWPTVACKWYSHSTHVCIESECLNASARSGVGVVPVLVAVVDGGAELPRARRLRARLRAARHTHRRRRLLAQTQEQVRARKQTHTARHTTSLYLASSACSSAARLRPLHCPLTRLLAGCMWTRRPETRAGAVCCTGARTLRAIAVSAGHSLIAIAVSVSSSLPFFIASRSALQHVHFAHSSLELVASSLQCCVLVNFSSLCSSGRTKRVLTVALSIG